MIALTSNSTNTYYYYSSGCFFDTMSDFNVPGSRPKKHDEISEIDRIEKFSLGFGSLRPINNHTVTVTITNIYIYILLLLISSHYLLVLIVLTSNSTNTYYYY